MTPPVVRFGILGAGMIADYHRRAIEANANLGAQLVALGHHDPGKFATLGAAYGVPCVSDTELLEHPDIDAICICTPSGQHPEQTIRAARHGKHVLVEKPMATRLADAEAMIAACSEAGVQLGVVLQRRTDPLFRRIHSAVRAGDLGELTLGLVTMPYHRPQSYYDQSAWRGSWAGDGGGVLMNQGIHLVDLLVWYMGDPTQVKAFAATLQRAVEVEDTLAATLQFGNGALATIAATTTAPGSPHRLELYGTKGAIQVEGEQACRWQLQDPSAAQVEPPSLKRTAAAGAAGDPRGISPSGHIQIVRDFVSAVQEGRPPQIDGSEGRRSLAATEAIYHSAKQTDKPVSPAKREESRGN